VRRRLANHSPAIPVSTSAAEAGSGTAAVGVPDTEPTKIVVVAPCGLLSQWQCGDVIKQISRREGERCMAV